MSRTDKEKRGRPMLSARETVSISRSRYDAVIFDMDGVITQTARVHAAAWKALFDEYREQTNADWAPFDPEDDYIRYVDGKPRYDGIRSFLESRNIQLPHGSPEDPPGRETVCGLGNRKNRLFRDMLKQKGVEVYESAVEFVNRLNRAGFKTAVISASKNCQFVLQAAGIEHLFEERVDGVVSEGLELKGKPEPDIFLEAARRLHAQPVRSVVVEDALAGTRAGQSGHFGLVIGVDRTGHAQQLKESGADVVVQNLSQIQVNLPQLPRALDHLNEIIDQIKDKTLTVFLDYDGTLTPIVASPDQAVLSASMRDTVTRLARRCTVAVISGRDLSDVRDKVGIDNLFYAGSHGFEIAGPQREQETFQQGEAFLPKLDEAESRLREKLKEISGVLVERKKFSIAVHYRNVSRDKVEEVAAIVDRVASQFSDLRKSSGKKVYEVQPDMDWDKGKALFWVLEALELQGPGVLPLYLGDDTTDEDAFEALKDRGIGIVVMEDVRSTQADYRLKNPEEVERFLDRLASI
ncbi:MAG: trehalose-phosphatase [Desulfatiglandaceae bacterium]